MYQTTEAAWSGGDEAGYVDSRFLHTGPLLFVPHLVWIVAAFATLLIPSPTAALLVVALMSLLWSGTQVLKNGGPYLLPSSVMYLASAVFIGFACYYLVLIGSKTMPDQLRLIAVLVFAATVFMEVVRSALLVRWRVAWVHRPRGSRAIFSEHSPRHFLAKALLLLAISLSPVLTGINMELAKAVGMVGVMMLVLGGISWRTRIRWGGDVLIVIGSIILPIIWVSMVFKGGGRLVVAGLGIAVALTWNLVKPTRVFKVAVLVALPLFLVGAGLNRAQLKEEQFGPEAGGGVVEGLYSVYDPLDRLGQVLTEERFPGGDSIGPRYGATFVNALLMPIPRDMWEGKPVGFGAEVTQLMNPGLVAKGQSFSILGYGEWYANFGWAGLVLMPVALGALLAVLDRRHAELVNSSVTSSDDWWRAVTLGCVVSSLGDLFWGGAFTFYTRGGMAFLVAFAMWRMSRGRLVPVAARAGAPTVDSRVGSAVKV